MEEYNKYWIGEFSDGEIVVFSPELQESNYSDEVRLWSYTTGCVSYYRKDIARKALRKTSNGRDYGVILAAFLRRFTNLNPYIILKGNWDSGLAVDLHTISSIPAGVNEYGHTMFNTIYTQLGELVNKCKYHNDASVIPEIVQHVAPAVGILGEFDFIIPVPPSKHRALQPVSEIAKLLGAHLNIPLLNECLNSRPRMELKGVTSPEERIAILRSNITMAQTPDIINRSILVFDDLYRSGSTLCVVCELLSIWKPAKLCVLCLTKTRTNR